MVLNSMSASQNLTEIQFTNAPDLGRFYEMGDIPALAKTHQKNRWFLLVVEPLRGGRGLKIMNH